MRKNKNVKAVSARSIGSMKEFEEKYLPMQSKKNNMVKLTPKQFGQQLANSSIAIVKEVLSKKQAH